MLRGLKVAALLVNLLQKTTVAFLNDGAFHLLERSRPKTRIGNMVTTLNTNYDLLKLIWN